MFEYVFSIVIGVFRRCVSLQDVWVWLRYDKNCATYDPRNWSVTNILRIYFGEISSDGFWKNRNLEPFASPCRTSKIARLNDPGQNEFIIIATKYAYQFWVIRQLSNDVLRTESDRSIHNTFLKVHIFFFIEQNWQILPS